MPYYPFIQLLFLSSRQTRPHFTIHIAQSITILQSVMSWFVLWSRRDRDCLHAADAQISWEFWYVWCFHVWPVAHPALSVRRGKVKESSRFFPVFPIFFYFSPSFSRFLANFSLSGVTLCPLDPPVATPQLLASNRRYNVCFMGIS